MAPFADPSLPAAQVLNLAGSSLLPPQYRAMVRNLLCDHRVSPGRFAAFSAFAGPLADLDAIRRVLEAYQDEQVRPLIGAGLEPAYARPENHNNKVDLAPGSEIATVLDLTRLGRVYAEAKS